MKEIRQLPLKTGSLVMVRSYKIYYPVMTIIEKIDKKHIVCAWFDEKENLHSKEFCSDVLVGVS